jgi:hypothetical protein
MLPLQQITNILPIHYYRHSCSELCVAKINLFQVTGVVHEVFVASSLYQEAPYVYATPRFVTFLQDLVTQTFP